MKGVNRLVHNLTTSYNPDPIQYTEPVEAVNPPTPDTPATIEDHQDNALIHYETAFTAVSPPSPEIYPNTYRQAMLSKDKMNWVLAHKHELRSCEARRVWIIVHKSDVPKGRKIIGNRWIFTIKDDGRFRARTVAQGYSQIPGKDFHENHAPVIHDTTFHLILVMMLIHGLESEQFDIETAFLYGQLEEEIYMEFPDGYEDYLKIERGENYSSEEYCLLLRMALYGLVQAARQWYKKITSLFGKLDFFPSPADPCLFVKAKKGNEPPAYIILYVDDGAIIGTKQVIKEVISALSEMIKVKSLGPLKHFVGCHLIRSADKKTIYIHQPKLLKHLEDSFGQLCNIGNRCFLTPAAPKTVIVRPEKDMPLISPANQSQYRSGVGMLLYLVKHSRPDLANAVRELTKVLDKATIAHWKALLRTVKFVLDSKF